MDDELKNVPRPEIVEGSHRALLRQRLTQDMRGKEHMHMATSTGWKRRVVWACALAVGAFGVAWGATAVRTFVVQGGGSRQVTVQSKNGPVYWSTSSGGGSYPAASREEAEALHKAIQDAFAAGKYELVKTVPGDLAPVGIYKVTLPDGSTIELGASIPPYETPEQIAADDQEMQNQIDSGQGELVGLSDYGGLVTYMYRYTLSDGNVRTLGTNAPYLGNEEAVREEVQQLIAEGKGELRCGPPEVPSYCYRFTLSNGKLMLYYTDKPLNAE
jgi:hypothetical protein